MVEQKTYNTLPDLLKAHAKVLAHAIPNALSFDAVSDSIYGGGDALYESLASASTPTRKSSVAEYHAKIVLNHHWVSVTLELREAELTVVTVKSPLRTNINLVDVTECCLVEPRHDHLGGEPLLRVVAANQTHLFAISQASEWVQAVNEAVAEARRADASMSNRQRSAEEKLVQNIVQRRADASEMEQLMQAIFSSQRRPGMLSPIDILFVQCLNDQLAKMYKKKPPKGSVGAPLLQFSKLDLDMALNGAKCETQVGRCCFVVVCFCAALVVSINSFCYVCRCRFATS
jgi:hypothetical protein